MADRFVLVKIATVIVSAFSQILLKKSAMKHYDSVIREYLNPLVIIAYGLFFLSTILSVYALKGISISYSMILESLSYLMIPLLSFVFFKEKIGIRQILGIAVIVIGIIVFNC